MTLFVLEGAAAGDVHCPQIDTQQLDRQIKAIMTEVIPFLKVGKLKERPELFNLKSYCLVHHVQKGICFIGGQCKIYIFKHAYRNK